MLLIRDLLPATASETCSLQGTAAVGEKGARCTSGRPTLSLVQLPLITFALTYNFCALQFTLLKYIIQ